MHPELLKAIETGDIKALESLIASGVDIKQKNENGVTAFLLAAANGQIPMLEHLLAKKYATPTEKNNYGATALLIAVAKGQIPMLEHLLAKKYATITEKNNHGFTALLMAAAKGQIPMLEHLLAKKYATLTEKDSDGNTALLTAASLGEIPMVEHLLAKKYATITEKNRFGETALLRAATNGQIPLLEHLLAMPEVSIQERATAEGDNVLTLSAWFGRSKTVAYLLKRGAYIDLLLNNGRTPVQVIQNHSNKNALPLLQAAEALIQVATGKQAAESAEALVRTLGENLNARRVSDGNTALHLAIINKNLPLIKLLLANGADVTMPNKDQETPLQLLQRTYSNDPYILAVSHAENIAQIAENLDQQQKSSTKPGPMEDVKQRFESITRDAGDSKRGSEGLTIAGLQNKNSPLLAQCATSIEELESQLEKMPIATEDQRKEKQGLCYKVGALLANPLSSVYNPIAAYGFLSQITKESTKFPEAQGLMAELLISGNLIFQNSGLEAEPTLISVSAIGLEASTEDAACRALRQKAIIRHLLQGTSKHEEVIGKFIAEYTLGAEKSVAGLANVKGKDVDSQMALIEAFRERELENKLLQEKLQELQTKEAESLRIQERLQTKEAESTRQFALMQEKFRAMEKEYSLMQAKIAQFSLVQEKLKQFEIMKAENRRLSQENTVLKNQALDKDKLANAAAPRSPKR